MEKLKYNLIGVMSGTSLDGIDLANIHFAIKEGKWTFRLVHCETVPYSAEWVETLKQAVTYTQAELLELNKEYTKLLGEEIKNFIIRNHLTDVEGVCSHGHTILHQPNKGITLQIGNLPELAKIIDERVICDFRIQDVKLGGQGAPLVPIGDRILFPQYDYCLNLGGFSNISFESEGKRIAYDISPVNIVLNRYANILGLPYDTGGQFAKSGNLNVALLDVLNDLDYYRQPYPKSLGFEYVREKVFPLIDGYTKNPSDAMHTFVEHVAYQIAQALPSHDGSLLITGGGAHNNYLISRIKSYIGGVRVVIPDPKILEFKEALIFALLGALRLRNENNVLASVTGARQDHCAGYIFEKEELCM